MEAVRKFAPGQLMVLLHVGCTPANEYLGPGNAAFLQETMEMLMREGLIETYDQNVERKLTDRGMAYVEMLLQTPLPVQRWVDPREVP